MKTLPNLWLSLATLFLVPPLILSLDHGRNLSDLLWERCTSRAVEPHVTDSFCLIDGEPSRQCSGISNWHSCVEESAGRIDTPAAKLTDPAVDQFTYYPEGRVFCYRPEVEKGEKLSSFRGFAWVDLYVGRMPEHLTRVGCIYHDSVKVTRKLLQSTMCCTQFKSDWHVNQSSPFLANGYSVPHTIGAEQSHTGLMYLKDAQTFIPPGYKVPSPPEPKHRSNDYFWIIIGSASVVILTIIVVCYCKCSENFLLFLRSLRQRLRDCWQAIEKRFRPGMVNSDNIQAKSASDGEISGATQSAHPATESGDTDPDETIV